MIYYGEIKTNDISNGEGVRTSLFVSGCRNHCKNCFNPMTWDFRYGKPFDENAQAEIIDSCRPDWINGLSLLGGEPFEPENQQALLDFVRRFRRELSNKTVWCYSGFTFEELTGKKQSRATTPTAVELLKELDVLVDGPFIEEEKNISLAFRGSENQRIIDVKKTLESNEIVLYLK